jgi:hypothetical protein
VRAGARVAFSRADGAGSRVPAAGRSGYFRRGRADLAGDPAVMQFMNRDAGILVLIKFIQIRRGYCQRSFLLGYRAGFGVSRTHVRRCWKTLHNAATSASRAGAGVVELKPSIPHAFDPLRGRDVGA